MDFRFSEDQEALRGLAAKVLDDYSSPERLKRIERSGEPFDKELWSALADAGLLSSGLQEPVGAGMGLIGTCVVLEAIGRHVTPLPMLASIGIVAQTIDRFGSPPIREELLAGLARGSLIGSPALEEPIAGSRTIARAESGRWVLSGEKVAAPYAPVADLIMISAVQPDGDVGLFILDPGSKGLEIQPSVSTTGEPSASVQLDEVIVDEDRLIGGEAAKHAFRLGLASAAATAAGVLAGGLDLTAGYIGQRQQFGRAIASFQGPAMRIADAYIDSQAVWVSAWSAIWKLETGRAADEALAIAKFWVADGGQRAVHAFQHLHGGIGVDVDYPIHRYFTWAKSLEVMLGGASAQLERLGLMLAGEA
jgi:alkylation response protein AidB-like acyl-CoA dehydrogenase